MATKSAAKTKSAAPKTKSESKATAHKAPKAKSASAAITSENSATDMGDFFGKLFAFNNSLKLYHWHVTGVGSYAQHMALDQAIGPLSGILDRIVETTLAMKGDMTIVIPTTKTPVNIIRHCEDVFEMIDNSLKKFKEEFSDAILDDYAEVIQQLLYRLKRLK